MKEKHKVQEEPFNPEEHKKVALTWTRVRMKNDLDFRPLPPTFVQFSEQFKDGILSVDRTKTRDGTVLKRCLCGKIPCDIGCLTWPNLSLTVTAENNQQAAIHSNWVDPVEILPIEEDDGSFIEENDTFDDDLQPQELVVENNFAPVERPVAETAAQEYQERAVEIKEDKLMAVQLNAKGELLVCSLEDFIKAEEFCFDDTSGAWLFGDIVGELNKASILGEDPKDGFLMVMEFKIEPLYDLLLAFDSARRAMLREDLGRNSKDAEKIISTIFSSMIAKI